MPSDTSSNTAIVSQEPAYNLQCMEIIGGNEAVHNAISSPGLDIWVHSEPFAGNVGGDIHYFSMCGSGRVTRLCVADVSGHGPDMDDIAKSLRALMRKHINQLDQTRFAQDINREFTEHADSNYFATVLLATYFAPTDHLIVCNAGHPRPLWYSTKLDCWQLLHQATPNSGPSIREARGTYLLSPVSNLPLGIIEPTDYYQFDISLQKGDIVLIYTDALIEARTPDDQLLGEEGLLDLASKLTVSQPQKIAPALLDAVSRWRGGAAPEDDQTLIVLHHNASDPPTVTAGQAAQTMLKMLGLKRV